MCVYGYVCLRACVHACMCVPGYMFTCAHPAVVFTVLPPPPTPDTDITAFMENMEALTGMFYGILHALAI